MYTLIFSIVWTVLAALFVAAFHYEHDLTSQHLAFQIIFPLMPFAGLLFIWDSYRKYCRFKSVHVEQSDKGEVFVWVDLDGSEKRDTIDPRIKWDEEDRNFSDN